MSNGRIPTTISKFFGYVETTDNYLQLVTIPTAGIRLGLSSANVTAWHTFGTSAAALYLQYKDPLVTGPSVKKKVKKMIKDFKVFAQPQLNIVAASESATEDDASVFNVVLERKNPTHKETEMTAICYVIAKMLGGAKLQFKCRSLTDAKRPSLIKGADSVEMAYIIGDADTKVQKADDITLRKVVTKAAFILSLGTINSGKVLYIYFRWNNTKHPEFAGPWSELQIIQVV